MYFSLKQAIFRENRLSLSEVMSNFVRKKGPGNMKKMPNWPTLPRDFPATARNKNSRLVTKVS
jgi:hypothetical protein